MKNKVFLQLILICTALLPTHSHAITTAKSKSHRATKAPRSTVKEIWNKNEFDKIISQNNLVVADFYSPSCRYCIKMAPIFEELAQSNKDITFVKVNTTNSPDLARVYKVRGMPTFIFFKNGNIINTDVGESTKAEFQQDLDRLRK